MSLNVMPRGNKYYHQFIQLSPYQRIIIFLLIAAGLIGFWLTTIYFKMQNSIDFYMLQKQNLENQINLILCSPDDIAKLQKNIETQNFELTQYKKSNSKDNELTLIIKHAKKLNVVIVSCNKKNKPCEQSWYTQNNVTLTVQGSLENITSFFKAINSVAICGYSPCTITHDGNNLFQATCTLTYLTVKDESAQKPKTKAA